MGRDHPDIEKPYCSGGHYWWTRVLARPSRVKGEFSSRAGPDGRRNVGKLFASRGPWLHPAILECDHQAAQLVVKLLVFLMLAPRTPRSPGAVHLTSGMSPQHVAHAKCTYIQPDSEYGMCHQALQPGLRWFGRS